MGNYVITCDVGTTGIKTCLYDIGDTFQLIAAEMAGYHLYIGQNGSAEQEPCRAVAGHVHHHKKGDGKKRRTRR